MLLKTNADAYAEHTRKEKDRKRYAKIKKNNTAVRRNSFPQVPLQPVSTSLCNRL